MASASVAPAVSNTLAPRASRETVVRCYEFFDHLFPECGLLDLTEGMYHGHPELPYEEAQRNQLEWLLDEARVAAGSRLLDVGCGNGTLLEAAGRRGVEGVGITISPPQVARCRERGLDARVLDYRDMDANRLGRFDAVIANGSIEHFVQPEDVVNDRMDAIYTEMFVLFAGVIDPESPSRRVVTTVIHRHEHTPQIDRDHLLRGPLGNLKSRDHLDYALLQRGFGGYYPALGQLERCAAPHFRLVREVDGTEDYRLTSEACFRRVRQSLLSWRTGPHLWATVGSYLLHHPRHGATMLACLLVAESWQRQFRGVNPPTRLLRQTWEAN